MAHLLIMLDQRLKQNIFLFNPDIYGINDHIIDLFYQKANELNDNFSCLGPRYNELKNIKQSDKKKEINRFSISGSAMFFYIKTLIY